MNNGNIRVLIADDSYFVRSMIRVMLEKEADIEVIGEAKDGLEAVARVIELKPDVVTMDFNMPGINGEQATAKIFQSCSQPPAIIMFSARTQEGAEVTLNCLNAGAIDFLAKPAGEVSINLDSIQELLIQKIRVASKAKISRHNQFHPSQIDERKYLHFHPRIIVMGSSTGGPPVVEYILKNLKSLTVPLVVVQHMPKKFTRFFAERLDKIIPFPIKEACEGEALLPGHCYVAPGGWHLEIHTEGDIDVVRLNSSEAYFGLRPSINNTMVSAAALYGGNVLGIILTGMGNDGTEGIEAIKNAGGVAIAQDPETAVVDSMPSSIIKKGLVDEVLTPWEIVGRLSELNN